MSVSFMQMKLLFHAIKLLKSIHINFLLDYSAYDCLIIYFASDWLTAEFETDLNYDH